MVWIKRLAIAPLGAAITLATAGDATVSTSTGVDADWSNFGGNARRNGLTSVTGPSVAKLLWENDDDFSIIAWHPVTLGDRVFAIREAGFPGNQANDTLVAYDLDAGAELWRVTVPYGGNSDEEWIAYVAGANGWASNPAGDGRIWAFDQDLTNELFTLSLDRQNSGGPSLGARGTLVVADRRSVRTYRTPACLGDLDGSGDVGLPDLLAVRSAWDNEGGPEDLDGSGLVDFDDLLLVLALWGPCP